MASPTIQVKRGLFANLPALRAGEPGFTTDKYDLYLGIGAGTTASNQFYGSSRYWTRENGSNAAEFKFVDRDGTNGVSLRSPAEVTTPVTYTLPQGGSPEGYYLKLGENGVLEWASVSEGATFENATFTGITTFNGLIDATEGLQVTGHTELDDLNVSGIGTFANVDIDGGTIDGTVIGGETPAEATFTELAYDNSTTTGISTVGELHVGTTQVLYDDDGLITLAGINTVDATTIATLEALLSLDPNDFSSLNIAGIATIGGLLDASGGLDVFGHTELDDLNVTGVATFSQAIDADILGNAGTATSLSDARDFSVSGDVATSVNVPFDGTANLDLVVTLSSTFSANTSGIITSTGGFVGDLTGNADTATSADTVDTTATSDNVSYYIPFVANSSSTTGETVRVGTGISFNPSTNTLNVANVETGAINAKDGTGAITISDATGNVSFASTVTITGDLQVLGSTTTVNTETLLVKDPIIDLGLIDNGSGDLIAPTGPTATDLALVFHYYDSSAKQSSLYWDHDNENGERFVLASDLTGHTVGVSTTTVEASAYAALEVGTLWINNACSGGAQEVIGCNGNSELALMNLVVDAGEF
jgi:hypothetical protein